jgi:predicted RNase H-like HicB family nuclease
MKMMHAAIYPAVFNPIPDGGYEVSFPAFPGCVTFGSSFEEAQSKATEVLELWIEELEAERKNIPSHTERPIIADVKVAFA